ncbi:hypothetical protein ACVWZW_001683 [Bradyrhizobium sp. F1.13.4]
MPVELQGVHWQDQSVVGSAALLLEIRAGPERRSDDEDGRVRVSGLHDGAEQILRGDCRSRVAMDARVHRQSGIEDEQLGVVRQ